MKLENLNDEIMVTCALRYCLGRQSYVVGSCIDFIKQVWDQLPKSSQGVIVRDILEAFDEGNVGMDMDASGWRDLVRWCFNNLDKETEIWLFKALSYRENAIDALNYNDIGRTVKVKDKNDGWCDAKITGYSDKHGIQYKLISWNDLDKEWFNPEEIEFKNGF
jgi:hypothetical protein